MNVKKEKIEQGYEIAKIWEISLKQTFEHFFNTKLCQTDRFNLFDYISTEKDIYIELKTRTCSHLKYKDTMIGMNKINRATDLIKKGKKIYFIFKFTDGVYYWEYKDTYDNEWVRGGGRSDRGVSEWKTNGYLYIPNNLLLKI